MDSKSKTVGAVLTSVALIGTSAAGVAFANQDFTKTDSSDTKASIEISSDKAVDSLIEVSGVQGTFGYDQNVLSSNAQIASVFKTAVAALCSSLPDYDMSEDQPITVKGDVPNEFAATIDEMAEEDEESSFVMACACAANIAGGGAIANADVSGVSVESIAKIAGVE